MRCNVCSRLFTTGNVNGRFCVCGSKAWFLSHITWFERLRFLFGIDTDAEQSLLNFSNKPIGGRKAVIHKAWDGPPEEKKDGNLST